MQISAVGGHVKDLNSDVVVVGVHADTPISGVAAEADSAMGGAISRLLEAGEISTKAGKLSAILAPQGLPAVQLLVLGLGDKADLDCRRAYRATAAAAKQLSTKPRKDVAFCFDDWDQDLLEAAICGAMVGCQGQDLYRADKKHNPFPQTSWHGGSEETLRRGEILGTAVNLTRRLVNEPAGVLYPETFAERIVALADDTDIEVEVWDTQKLKEENCGALLGVAQGSAKEPRLVILRYSGGTPDQAPLALVGKGVTFDSGGLSLKPTEGMKTMKCDMGGAATVVGAIKAIADLQLGVNVVGLVGLVENMVSGTSYKLGDVLTARNGKTIEVLNTDAEGRLVLADVLSVAVDQGADRIIDLATLTGACIVALGGDTAGAMTNDQQWCDTVLAAAERSGEHVWQLPMYREFADQIRSGVADLKNVGEGRWGGAITAAKLLEAFVADTPWVHLDIAGPSFLDSSKSWQDGGATGALVRTLVEVARG